MKYTTNVSVATLRLLKDIIVNTRAKKREQINREIKAKGGTVKTGRSPKDCVLPDDHPLAGVPHAVLSETSASDNSYGDGAEEWEIREPHFDGRTPHGFAGERRPGTGLGHVYKTVENQLPP